MLPNRKGSLVLQFFEFHHWFQSRRRRHHSARHRRLVAEALESRLPLTAGLELLADLNPGPLASSPGPPVVIGNVAYFAADDGSGGTELWRTDGTPTGTARVKDIRPGPVGSQPQFLTNVNGTLYFRANDGVHGDELWKSDGTETGTVLVQDLATEGGQGSYPGNLVVAGDLLYFTANSDAESQATTYGPMPYLSQADSPFDQSLTDSNFWLEDFEDSQLDVPGVSASAGSVRNPGSLTDSVDADDGTIDGDGRLGHSYLVRPQGITQLTFTFDTLALGGLPSEAGLVSTGGEHLLTVDFLDAAGNLIARLQDDFTKPQSGETSDDRFLGLTYAGGIRAIRITHPGTGNSAFEIDHLQFGRIVRPTGAFELWKSDGTPEGTSLVTNLGFVPQFAAVEAGDALFFTAQQAATGVELWKTTPSGTALVLDINSGPASSNPRALTNVNGTLYFSASEAFHGDELWKADDSGASLVKDIDPGSTGSELASLTNLNGVLVFSAREPVFGNELWRSDGSSAGTLLIKDVRPGTPGSAASNLTIVQGELFFAANDGVHGLKLWKSDGTSGGTTFVSDLVPGSGGGGLNALAEVNGGLLFSAISGSFGFEPWQSNGTAAGTTLVSDLNPAQASSVPRDFVAINGRVLFLADDGVNGRELWVLDINDAPSFVMLDHDFVVSDEQPTVYSASAEDHVTPAERVPSLTFPDWITDRSPGPANESWQKLTLTVSASNPPLFVDQPAIDHNGTLTFTPAPNAHGTAIVTVTLSDDGGAAAGGANSFSRSFEITVTKPHAWHNIASPLDVTNNNHIAGSDALAVINFLNAFGPTPVPNAATSGPVYYDVTRDDFVTASDALAVINAVNAGAAAVPSTPGAAAFVGVDTATQGSWLSKYGADGFALAAEQTSLPAYATLSFTGGLTDLHDRIDASSTTDPRALQKPDASGRIMAAWTGDHGFTLDIKIIDGHSHQVALYVLDANTNSRSMQLDLVDAATGEILDTQSVSEFNGGKYLVWSISGHVQIRFTRLSNGLNTVLSGIFFDGPDA